MLRHAQVTSQSLLAFSLSFWGRHQSHRYGAASYRVGIGSQDQPMIQITLKSAFGSLAMRGDAPLAVPRVKSQEKSATATQQALTRQLSPAQHPPPSSSFQYEEGFNNKIERLTREPLSMEDSFIVTVLIQASEDFEYAHITHSL